jgi:fluoroquinolone transport system permease protein
MKQIRRDDMTALFFILPVVLAFAFRFGIPVLQGMLSVKYGMAVNLPDYYSLFDLIMILITPFFFGFGASMVILGEMDEHILLSYYYLYLK